MTDNPFPFSGLNDDQVQASRLAHGGNSARKKRNQFLLSLKESVTEPMFVLLVAAAVIYSVLGELSEALFMGFAILIVSTISLYQDSRSRKALEALREYTQSKARVIRNNLIAEVPNEELVVGDYVVCEEGSLLAADGEVVHSHDFSVNESILTGEAYSVFKDTNENSRVYQGTLAVSGLAVYKVSTIGLDTQLGKIGESLQNIESVKTPLQLQIERFVRSMAIVGIVFFMVIWGINFFHSHDIYDSLLKGLTLAMSILPEEIPVAFTTFMALGAWRLMRQGVVVKHIKTVESLGTATVICTDKTGTITENRMELVRLYLFKEDKLLDTSEFSSPEAHHLIQMSMWASEPVPFDPMEKAIHTLYGNVIPEDERAHFQLVHEYPLGGSPPMMTHVFKNKSHRQIVAAKGAVEALVRQCNLSEQEHQRIELNVRNLSSSGYRVLAIGEAELHIDTYPSRQEDIRFSFIGLIAFFDPPKTNIKATFDQFYQAGIDIKIITGDNAFTSMAIARQAGINSLDITISGDQLQSMDDATIKKILPSTHLFVRMFPEAKLRVINLLSQLGEVVAMTGDGVNDGPALKASAIGIAMGKRGSEVARQAADLILLEDDLSRMVDSIALGRKIYSNLKKAIQYIISIHIPIILTVAVPLILGWVYPNIFTPVHVIFLELIMGPTCSIAYESEPMEKGVMSRPPRKAGTTFLNWNELSTSLLQGLVITLGTLGIYQYGISQNFSEDAVRSIVYVTLITANIFLTLVNRSTTESFITSLRQRNELITSILALTIILTILMFLISPVREFFHLQIVSPGAFCLAVVAGLFSVIWFELVKAFRRTSHIS